MNVLHIVRTSAFSDHKLGTSLNLMNDTDTLFLIDDGVYNVLHPRLAKAGFSEAIYVLADHLNARGISYKSDNIIKTDMQKLVELTEQASKVLTWQ